MGGPDKTGDHTCNFGAFELSRISVGRKVGRLPLHVGLYSQLMVCSRYRTIVDRLLGMRLVPARRLVKRDVSYEFMNRQMVWHAFTVRLLLHILSFMLFTAFFSIGIPDLLTSNTPSSSTSPCSQYHTHRYRSSLDHLAECIA